LVLFTSLVLFTGTHAFIPLSQGSFLSFLSPRSAGYATRKLSGQDRTLMMSEVTGSTIDEALADDDDDYDPFDDILDQAFTRRASIKKKAEEVMTGEKERIALLQVATLEKLKAEKERIAASAPADTDEADKPSRADLLNVADLLTTAGREKKKPSVEEACEGVDSLQEMEDFDPFQEMVVSTNNLLEHLFEMADDDCSGAIDRDEFRVLFNLLTVLSGGSTLDPKSEEELQHLFSSIDFDESGTVEMCELQEWITDKVQKEWPELYNEIDSWNCKV